MGGGGGDNKIEETAYEKQLSRIAKEKWDDYQRRWKPFETKAIKDVTGDTTSMERMTAGKINADIAQSFQRKAIEGIDPSSGRAMMIGRTADLAEKAGRSQAMGTQQIRDTKAAGLKAAVDIGRGQSTSSQLGISQAAQTAVQNEISNAYDQFNEGNSYLSALSMAAGAGTAWAGSGYPNLFKEPSKMS